MILIDAELFRDELFSHYEFLKVDDYEVWAVVDIDEVLDNIEEVKAIPIEWIKNWYSTNIIYLDDNKPLGKGLYAFEQMIYEWEKENDKETEESH